MIERRQLRGRSFRVIENGGDESVDRLGIGDAIQAVVDDAHLYAVALASPILLGWVDAAQIGAVRQLLLTRKARVLLDPPEQISSGLARLVPKREAEKLPVRQAQHARSQTCQHGLGQGDLTRSIARHLAGEQHVRAVLDQGHKANLRISTAAAAGAGPAEGRVVGRLIGNVQRAAIQADQTPVPIPGPTGRTNRDRLHHRVMQLAHRFPSEPRAGLRNA